MTTIKNIRQELQNLKKTGNAELINSRIGYKYITRNENGKIKYYPLDYFYHVTLNIF
jgi:hypothetical protein